MWVISTQAAAPFHPNTLPLSGSRNHTLGLPIRDAAPSAEHTHRAGLSLICLNNGAISGGGTTEQRPAEPCSFQTAFSSYYTLSKACLGLKVSSPNPKTPITSGRGPRSTDAGQTPPDGDTHDPEDLIPPPLSNKFPEPQHTNHSAPPPAQSREPGRCVLGAGAAAELSLI